MRLLPVLNADQAALSVSAEVLRVTDDLPQAPAEDNLPGRVAQEVTEGSAFWPELDPRTRQDLIDRGKGQAVELAERLGPELAMAVNKGFPMPRKLRERIVYELSLTMMFAAEGRLKMGAIRELVKMALANDNPRALPDQLEPGAGSPGVPSIQVNVQNNIPGRGEPSVSVSELVDEMLSRADVQDALNAGLPVPPEEYGI